ARRLGAVVFRAQRLRAGTHRLRARAVASVQDLANNRPTQRKLPDHVNLPEASRNILSVLEVFCCRAVASFSPLGFDVERLELMRDRLTLSKCSFSSCSCTFALPVSGRFRVKELHFS